MNLIEQNVEDVIKSQGWPDLTDKRVLITGGTGLVGLHMATFFKMRGAIVRSIYRSQIPEYFKKYLPWAYTDQRDLADPDQVPKYGYYDYIVHAAGYAQPDRFMKDPLSTIAINTICTNDLFKNLAPDGKFLYISSDAVYTSCDSGYACSEASCGQSNLNHPRAAYIESKKLGELITKFNGGISGRLSYAYGPGCKLGDNRVINKFIQSALIYGMISPSEGYTTRSWLYIADALYMLLNILFYGEPGEVYNIANSPSNSVTIRRLANLIGRKTKTRCVEGIPQPDTSLARQVYLSIDKFELHFGPMEFTSLEAGVSKTISWYSELIKSQEIENRPR
jgi:nucleoside-diphosphate-sugar epimerase